MFLVNELSNFNQEQKINKSSQLGTQVHQKLASGADSGNLSSPKQSAINFLSAKSLSQLQFSPQFAEKS